MTRVSGWTAVGTSIGFGLACGGGEAPDDPAPSPEPSPELAEHPAWHDTTVVPFAEAVADGIECRDPWRRTYTADGRVVGDPWGVENVDPEAWSGSWNLTDRTLTVTGEGLEEAKRLTVCPEPGVWTDGEAVALLCHQDLVACDGTRSYWVRIDGSDENAGAAGRVLVTDQGTAARPRRPIPVVRGEGTTSSAIVVTWVPGMRSDALGGDLFEASAGEIAQTLEAKLGWSVTVQADPDAAAPVVIRTP